MAKSNIVKDNFIKNKIFTVRGLQVILDVDLADFYSVQTKRLNEQVKRNIERFPKEFMFQLTQIELDELLLENLLPSYLRSHSATSNSKRGGRRYLPYVFTEQGVAMLSGVLKSETAVNVSIQIINTFVSMRRFLASNIDVFKRLNTIEQKQIADKIETNQKFDKIFQAIEEKDIKPKQGIFYDGQVFDAYKFVSDLIRSAKKSIVIIDNYIDDSVLVHLTKRKKNISVLLLTKVVSKQLSLDVKKFNTQYPSIKIRQFKNSHDRFIVIDEKNIYHFGASLKDLGKKWFAFTKMDIDVSEMFLRLKKIKNSN